MITICRADELEQIIKQGRNDGKEYDAVLSIEHPGATTGHGRAPRLTDTPQHILSFWDVEDESAENGPSESVVKSAFDFLDKHAAENIIVHCHAGKSRSVALAIGWIAKDLMSGLPKEQAVEHAIDYIKSIRPIAAPNMAVINIIDRLYGFDGTLTLKTLNDPLFAENSRIVNAKRAHIAATRPELMAQMYPEKFGEKEEKDTPKNNNTSHNGQPPKPQ